MPCQMANDIYYNDLKICGILIENGISSDKLAYSIAGVGININQDKFDSMHQIPPPEINYGKEYDISGKNSHIVSSITRRYNQVISGNSQQIENDYLARLYQGEYHNYIDCINGKEFEARIIGLDLRPAYNSRHVTVRSGLTPSKRLVA